MQEIKEQKHITDAQWSALQEHVLEDEDFMEILAHTCTCTFCAERFASVIKMQETEPPAYLTEEILERVRQPDVRSATTVREVSHRLQLLLYSLKVGAAVAFSILILELTVNLWELGSLQQSKEDVLLAGTDAVLEGMNRAADGIAANMNEFADLILNGGKR